LEGSLDANRNQPLTGVAWAFSAVTLFAAQDALVKWLTVGLPLFQLMCVRSVVAVLIVAVVMRTRVGGAAFRTARPGRHVLRALTNIVAFLCHYYAIIRMPLADATALALSAPLFVTVMSGVLLGEPADLRRKLILLVGFIGVVIVVQPTGNVDWLGVGAALLGSALFALLAIQNRFLSRTESTEQMVLYGALAFLLITGVTMPVIWVDPTPSQFWFMLALGIVSLGAVFCITHSYRFAAVYVIAPAEYVVILWAIFYGWILFSELPSLPVLFGVLIVTGSGVYLVRLERKTQLRNAEKTPEQPGA
jgi:drug/metabolite transporter (DMT)-like permease